MKLEVTLCHSQLMSMLLQPEKFSDAVQSYTASPPDMNGEGFNGYMEVKATFLIKDLKRFTDLWYESTVYPSDRAKWYYTIRNSILGCNQ